MQDWHAVDKDEAAMAGTLVATGPLSVLLDATGLQHYRKGVWAPKKGILHCKSDGTDLDHAVLMVGFGTDGGTDYWTIKNSATPLRESATRAPTDAPARVRSLTALRWVRRLGEEVGRRRLLPHRAWHGQVWNQHAGHQRHAQEVRLTGAARCGESWRS